MYKLPMFGCTDPSQVLNEISNCTKSFPDAYIRLVAFDQVRSSAVHRRFQGFLTSVLSVARLCILCSLIAQSVFVPFRHGIPWHSVRMTSA